MIRGFYYGMLGGIALVVVFYWASVFRSPSLPLFHYLCLPGWVVGSVIAPSYGAMRGIPWHSVSIGTVVFYTVVGVVIGALFQGRRPKPGFCLKCGYNLTGNVSGVCPECGETVPLESGDPEDMTKGS